jgi:hypothetical protein
MNGIAGPFLKILGIGPQFYGQTFPDRITVADREIFHEKPVSIALPVSRYPTVSGTHRFHLDTCSDLPVAPARTTGPDCTRRQPSGHRAGATTRLRKLEASSSKM